MQVCIEVRREGGGSREGRCLLILPAFCYPQGEPSNLGVLLAGCLGQDSRLAAQG